MVESFELSSRLEQSLSPAMCLIRIGVSREEPKSRLPSVGEYGFLTFHFCRIVSLPKQARPTFECVRNARNLKIHLWNGRVEQRMAR